MNQQFKQKTEDKIDDMKGEQIPSVKNYSKEEEEKTDMEKGNSSDSDVCKKELDEVDTEKIRPENNESVESAVSTKGDNENIEMKMDVDSKAEKENPKLDENGNPKVSPSKRETPDKATDNPICKNQKTR